MNSNEKRILSGARKPVTGIKRRPAAEQAGKRADQPLSTARDSLLLGTEAEADAKLFEKVTGKKGASSQKKKTAKGRDSQKGLKKKETGKAAGKKSGGKAFATGPPAGAGHPGPPDLRPGRRLRIYL